MFCLRAIFLLLIMLLQVVAADDHQTISPTSHAPSTDNITNFFKLIAFYKGSTLTSLSECLDGLSKPIPACTASDEPILKQKALYELNHFAAQNPALFKTLDTLRPLAKKIDFYYEEYQKQFKPILGLDADSFMAFFPENAPTSGNGKLSKSENDSNDNFESYFVFRRKLNELNKRLAQNNSQTIRNEISTLVKDYDAKGADERFKLFQIKDAQEKENFSLNFARRKRLLAAEDTLRESLSLNNGIGGEILKAVDGTQILDWKNNKGAKGTHEAMKGFLAGLKVIEARATGDKI